MINKILEKIINPEKVITKLMLLAGSFILILNQFTLEYLLFPESAVMCLGVLFNVIAIKFMVDNPKCKYIKIFSALLVAVFCYQGVLNMFPVLAILVYIVKQILDKREYKVKEKEFFAANTIYAMHTADTVHTVEAKITTFAISTIFASFAKETVKVTFAI